MPRSTPPDPPVGGGAAGGCDGVGGGDVGGFAVGDVGVPPLVMARLSNCAVSPWLVPMPATPDPKVESDTEPTDVPSTVAVMVDPEKPSATVCQRLVPSEAVLPLRRVVFWPDVLLR